jgi:hypothetical protein
MNLLDDSRVAGWVSRQRTALGPRCRVLLARVDRLQVSPEAPIGAQALSGLVGGSRIAHAVSRLTSRIDQALADSIIVTRVRRLANTRDAADLIGIAGWTVAVAAAVHLVLLATIEGYPFPHRAAMVLPSLLLVLGLAAVLFRRPIAAARADRRVRSR